MTTSPETLEFKQRVAANNARILEPDGEPQRRAARAGAGHHGAIGVRRDGQREAFEAAPAIAVAEQAQRSGHACRGRRIIARQCKGEQSAPAGEVALPQGMAGVGGKQRAEHLRDLRLGLQPLRHLQGRA